MAGFGQQFEVKRSLARGGDGINQGGECSEMNLACILGAGAEAAVEIPVIHAFWQGLAPLALHVFSDFVLGRFKNAVAVLAFDV